MTISNHIPIGRSGVSEDGQESYWHVLSHIVIRKAGFPIDWLEQLSSPVCAEIATRIAARLQELVVSRARLLRVVFPEMVRVAQQDQMYNQLRALSRLRHKVGRGTLRYDHLTSYGTLLPESLLVQLRSLCELTRKAEAERSQAEQLFEQQYALKQQMLRELIGDPLFQEAIFLSNPDMYNNSLLPLVSRRDVPISSALERKLWAYLQRFCGKNDTASFFGPLNYGRIVPDQEENMLIENREGKYRQREAFISFWVVNRLAQLMSSEPELKLHLCPRLHPQSFWEGTTVYSIAHERHVHLSSVQQSILHRVNGSYTVQDIADHLRLPATEVAQVVDKMVAAKILICHVEVPSTVFHPLASLIQSTTRLPDTWERKHYWLARLQQLEQLRQNFIHATLPKRKILLEQIDELYQSTTHESPRRNAGGTYADRTPIYEECLGTLETFQMSGAFFTKLLQRLSAVLDLSAGYGTLLQKHYQELGRCLFIALSPDGSPVSYAQFIQEMNRKQRDTPIVPTNEALERFRSAFEQLVIQRSDGARACLSAADIEQLLTQVPRIEHCHISPDIMLAAPNEMSLKQGDYQVVLGESHQVMYVWGSQLYFYNLKEDAEEEMVEHLRQMPEYAEISTILNERQHKGLLYEAFPGTFVEVYATPSAQSVQRVALRDLEVALVEEQLVLRHIRTGAHLRMYTAGDEQMHLWAFAFPRAMSVPVQFLKHTPRIEIGGTIYQRETWRLSIKEWGEDVLHLAHLALMVSSQEVRMRYNIPQYVYLHVASEPKPFFMDFSNIFSLEHFQQLLLHNEEIKLTEMLPCPDNLWMRDQDGHYCCEFRLTACLY